MNDERFDDYIYIIIRDIHISGQVKIYYRALAIEDLSKLQI